MLYASSNAMYCGIAAAVQLVSDADERTCCGQSIIAAGFVTKDGAAQNKSYTSTVYVLKAACPRVLKHVT